MKRAICALLGHRYFVAKEYGGGVRKVGCRRCGRAFGMNDRTRTLVDWDGELEELHEGAGKGTEV